MQPRLRPEPTATSVQAVRTHRVLLPSLRVAEFRFPNVGEFMKLREDAIRDATRATEGNGTPSDVEVGMVLGRLILRRLLSGITPRPATPIYVAGFSAEAVRAKAQAESDAAVAKGGMPLDVDALVDGAALAAEDVDAMKKTATLEPVTDLLWEEGWLGALSNADVDAPDGADMVSLVDFATMTFPTMIRGGDPLERKAKLRPRR